MVGRVLSNRGVVRKTAGVYELEGYAEFTPDQVQQLRAACDKRLAEYIARRGEAIWEHRSRSAGYISGTLRYDVLKDAKFHCELCGISAEERALEVDHITPRSRGGLDEISNLQALCYSCNAMKRDRDDTDLRAVRAMYEHVDPKCAFCAVRDEATLLQDNLAYALTDAFPVSEGHLLIIPKRHTADYFDLGTAEVRACQRLLGQARSILLREDSTISGFNVGINSGEAAGQTVMHCHIHLIPRRAGDNPAPRGGVRSVIPGRADYRQEDP